MSRDLEERPPAQRSRDGFIGALAAAAAAALPAAWLWGFTVDDALISARVAHQLATGHGYRFNPSGPVVDAVTPLGWAPVLSLFAARDAWSAVIAAKWLGAIAWCLAAGYLGLRSALLGRRAAIIAVTALLSNVPLGAWAVAGMETGLVTALATFSLGPGLLARLGLGLCAALRPELAPWVLALTVGEVLTRPESRARRLRRAAYGLALALGPFVLVAVLRVWWFGAAYPLSLLAKPSDARSGLHYVLGGLAFTGPFWLLAAGSALTRLSRMGRVLGVAALVHLAAVVLAGGDWMSLYRLFVPVLPSVILVGAEVGQRSSAWASALRVCGMLGSSLLLALGLAASARGVMAQRLELIERARPLLRGSQRIAALDVGWVGAATDANVVDLAGVTDPTVARLSGGHTSKRLPDSFLEARQVDALVLLAEAPLFQPLSDFSYTRAVEQRVSSLPGVERFQVVAVLPLRGTRQGYVVARRSPSD